ncbi:MAG: trypsin-like peptidase domain-containing protein [Gammaproteobacteria bacterium]|nr:trypsin-like peptidase domain-containing protein [Gammaproteobacteria bacterium]
MSQLRNGIQDVVERVRSGVIHIEFHVDGKRVASGSGFIAKEYLITNHHVFLGPANSTVILAWQPNQTSSSRTEIKMEYHDFAQSLVSGSGEGSYDFAILKIEELLKHDLYQFDLAGQENTRIGDQVMMLGFPFEHQNLVCHLGMISSFYEKRSVRVIQLDISVNQSNSGGPVLNCETGQVIGIITRKETGLTREFDMLMKAFQANLENFSENGEIRTIPADKTSLFLSQYQMQALSKEILRSANVGIGYAFSIEHILSDNALHSY